MIVEFRTYTLQPGTVPQFEERFGAALSARTKVSPLAAFWHTEVGPLNQVIHVWPYEDLGLQGRRRPVRDPRKGAARRHLAAARRPARRDLEAGQHAGRARFLLTAAVIADPHPPAAIAAGPPSPAVRERVYRTPRISPS